MSDDGRDEKATDNHDEPYTIQPQPHGHDPMSVDPLPEIDSDFEIYYNLIFPKEEAT